MRLQKTEGKRRIKKNEKKTRPLTGEKKEHYGRTEHKEMCFPKNRRKGIVARPLIILTHARFLNETRANPT